MDVDAEDVKTVIKAIAVDTAAGPDRILVRVAKQEPIAGVIAAIISVLLKLNLTKRAMQPQLFRHAKLFSCQREETRRKQTVTDRFRSVQFCDVL